LDDPIPFLVAWGHPSYHSAVSAPCVGVYKQ
jgi:hypothetical protein